jgi:2-polyprenyl-6-methoxyphenol hydroxylase-like FAD-dependent oxidoreductase
MTLDVVVAGGGPTGLMLACELRLAGAQPVVLERLSEPSPQPKANGLGGRVVQTLDYRGLLQRFSAQARYAGPAPSFPFGGVGLNLAALDGAPSLHVLLLPQLRLERLLGERARELGVDIRRGHDLLAHRQDDGGVTLDVRGPDGRYRLRTRYLVGCDGGESLVRKQADIAFPGATDRRLTRIGRVTLAPSAIVPGSEDVAVPGAGRLRPGWNFTPRGAVTVASFEPGVHAVAVGEDDPGPVDLGAPMTIDELQASARRVLGADLPIDQAHWLSRFVLQSRLAERYSLGRVLLAGDAAHLFSGGGGAPLNVALLDAVNLGWKLAAQVRGAAPAGLLDTYHTERHAAGERALMHTRAQSALLGSSVEAAALRGLFGELLQDQQPLRRIADMISGADIRYAMPGDGAQAHPLLGRFAPDLPLVTATGPTRVAEILRPARPVLLDLADRQALRDAAGAWRDRIEVVTARGEQPPADALLIRPDGYVAWVAALDDTDRRLQAGLRDALAAWFGAAA